MGAGVEGLEAEIVEDKKVGFAERFGRARVSPVALGPGRRPNQRHDRCLEPAPKRGSVSRAD
jgi:hypothetical protein